MSPPFYFTRLLSFYHLFFYLVKLQKKTLLDISAFFLYTFHTPYRLFPPVHSNTHKEVLFMKCPYCGTSYNAEDTICPSCGQPLSNAHYTPVNDNEPSGSKHAGRQGSAKKRKRRFLIILLILLLLTGGCIGGYFLYIHAITRRCEDAVHQIFSLAKSMDFSSVDPSYLPEALQENPNIRDYVRNYVNDSLEEYEVDGILERAGITIDTDELCNEVLQSAAYEITDVQTSYNRCTVFVHTENTDFSTLPEAISQEIEDNISSSSFWDSLQDIFSSIFSGHGHDGTDEEESNSDILASLYDDFRESAPTTETNGTIVFGIADEQWTLLSLDEDLFYSYYGLSALAE